MRRTTPSTAPRGATCSKPSSGRTTRNKLAQLRSRRQASEEDSSASRHTRSGCSSPTSRATRPPMLLPTTWADSSPNASNDATTERAKKRAS